ncbi:hypothetical protein [Clostridium oryzae]|uniref:Uncharacterized protein n=1 Tax=Clostridium oryzae TaxID=1450648 RepID=A0A1V4IBQ9_9CLOT|nr:hypothetical protein [Clostridium oryzae]OPJ57376.1 hypothetical protein CLORY_41530 [Clostridium oryzae]
MKISRLMKKKSIVFKWLTSYLILFMLVLSINVFIYLGMDTTLKTEINDENTFMLNATLRNMDNVLKNVKNISVELSKNSDIQHISLLKGKISNPGSMSIS